MKRIVLTVFFVFLLSSCTKVENYEIELQPGNDIIVAGDTWIDSGCNITINEELYTMKLENNPDTNSSGEYNLLYKYTFANEEFVCSRVVKVLDNEYPIVTLNPGIDTVYINESHTDAGITIQNETEDYTLYTTNNVDTSSTGSYEITYEVTNYDGFQTTIVRIVNVTTK